MSFSMMISTAPPVMNLEEAQRLRDEAGNPVDIEVRGRFPDVYFKVADVQTFLQIEDLHEILLTSDDHFQRKTHYEEFFITVLINNKFRKNLREMYLTHLGLLVVIFVIPNSSTKRLQEWISGMWLHRQMGLRDHRVQLASDILDVPRESIQNVFDHPVRTTTPSVFILSIGKVRSLRSEETHYLDGLDDDHLVVVYGCADDLQAVVAECYWKHHCQDVQTIYSHFVDPVFQMDAGKRMETIMSSYTHPLANTSMSVLHPSEREGLVQDLDEVFRVFRGRLTTIIEMNERLQFENKALQKELCSARQQLMLVQQIQNKELEIEHERCKCKDVLIRQLELELEHWKVQGEYYEKEMSGMSGSDNLCGEPHTIIMSGENM